VVRRSHPGLALGGGWTDEMDVEDSPADGRGESKGLPLYARTVGDLIGDVGGMRATSAYDVRRPVGRNDSRAFLYIDSSLGLRISDRLCEAIETSYLLLAGLSFLLVRHLALRT
jgi:hypothetical protein